MVLDQVFATNLTANGLNRNVNNLVLSLRLILSELRCTRSTWARGYDVRKQVNKQYVHMRV